MRTGNDQVEEIFQVITQENCIGKLNMELPKIAEALRGPATL